MPEWTYNDGGRRDAGYKGETRDCACRAICIATGMAYQDAYELIIKYAARERPSKNKNRSHPRTGVHTPTMRKIMADLGWLWVPTMQIGTGTTVHVRDGELPAEGRYVLALSRHYSTFIDGVIHDTYDPSREGTRAVYGYWRLPVVTA